MRANLLQPLISWDTLRMRQEAVQALMGSDDLAFTVQQGLTQMPKDLDRCASEAYTEQSTQASWIVQLQRILCKSPQARLKVASQMEHELANKGSNLAHSPDAGGTCRSGRSDGCAL